MILRISYRVRMAAPGGVSKRGQPVDRGKLFIFTPMNINASILRNIQMYLATMRAEPSIYAFPFCVTIDFVIVEFGIEPTRPLIAANHIASC